MTTPVSPLPRLSVATLIAQRLRREGGRPFVTFYDDASGERTELSALTWANWVAKTAGVLTDELDLAAGDSINLALPVHWLGTVFLVAAWWVGLEVTDLGDVTVSATPAADTLACSLHPFALPFSRPLNAGLDFGQLWPNQPDAYVGIDDSHSATYRGAPFDAVAAAPSDERILTDVNPASGTGLGILIGALRGRGSLVLVANAAAASWPARAEAERVDVVMRVGGD